MATPRVDWNQPEIQRNIDMTDSPNEYLAKPFLAALLLTRSIAWSEAAVLEGIRLWDGDGDLNEELTRLTVAAAVRGREAYSQQLTKETADASSLLPPELKRVLVLPSPFRECFILRRLLAIPSNFCARLLDLDPIRIEQATCLATQQLVEVDSANVQLNQTATAAPYNLRGRPMTLPLLTRSSPVPRLLTLPERI